MNVYKSYYIEEPIDGVDVEYEYEVEVTSYRGSTPAITNRAPEHCDPGEAAQITLSGPQIRRRRTDIENAPWELAPLTRLLDHLAYLYGITCDIGPYFYQRATVQDKAREYLENELIEECELQAQADYEAAADAKYEQAKDDYFHGN